MTAIAASNTWQYPYVPHTQQVIAHTQWAKERLYGGAAGGGKSEWLIAEVIGTCLKWNVDGLILRRTFPELSQAGGIIERLRDRIPPSIGTYRESDHTWTLYNGAKIYLGYLARDGDVTRYMGAEFGIIAWDQVEAFTEWQYLRMFHPLRSPIAQAKGFEPVMVASANPGGVGHAWVKARWVDPKPSGVVWQPAATKDFPNPGTRCFVQATIFDNPALANSTYRFSLENLPEDDRRALLYGDWDVYAGQMFKTFRRDVHVVSPDDWPLDPVQPRNIGIDYGNTAPFAALWVAWYPDNLAVVYRELYEANLTPTQQAEAILAAESTGERNNSTRRVPVYIDPSTFARGPSSPAPDRADQAPKGSIAYDYIKAGLPVRKANNDRLRGVATVQEALRVRGDGQPRLFIFENCRNLIRTLPALPRDNVRVEDVNTKAEDHAYDALRYALLSPRAPEMTDNRIPDARRAASGSTNVTSGMRDRPF